MSSYSALSPKMDSKKLAQLCRKLADNKKADDLLVLDVRAISSITDYFVIASGSSEPHLRAIAEEITDTLKEEHGVAPRATDGRLHTGWLVLDFFDVIVHVIAEERRARSIVLAFAGYVILGAAVGYLSLYLFPNHLIGAENLRVANLVITPLAVATVMALIGRSRERSEKHVVRLEQFAYAFAFAFPLAIVRYALAQ